MILKKKTNRQRLIDNLPVVVFEYTFFPDGQRDFTYLSPRCEELLGVDPEALMRGNLSLESFIHPEDWETFNSSVEESILRMSEWRWRGRCRGKGGYLWIDARGTPVRMKDGRTVYNGIFSDISEKKQLEQRYQELVEQLPLGIAIHAEGRVRFANAAACKMVGARSPQDVIGLEILHFVHPDFLELVNTRTARILSSQSTPSVELKYVRLDGSPFDVEASAHPCTYEGETAVQIIFTDISERKIAEASFKKTETLFYQLFQNTPLAVTLLNEEGKVVQINKGFQELFGFEIEELRGNELNQFIVPNDLTTEGNDINSLISSNRVIRTETVRHRRDGSILSVIIYGVPVLQQDRTIGIFGMYVDITERRRVEEELKIRNAELDNFVYKVSHDLRAPLSSVLGLAYLAGLPGNTDNLTDYIKLMGEKASQLDHFISDVLSHSKNLKMELKVEEVDFQKITDQAFNDLSYLKGAENVKKNIHISTDKFFSDPWRIAEIFRNLVSNAIKYRRLDGTETVISLFVKTGDRDCLIIFKDNGIGIDRINLEKIFEMFYRASDQSEGSGLGLYIVKNAVEKLGGKLQVESELGKGTTFEIVLPNQQLSK